MTPEKTVLAVDIGTTRCHVGTVDCSDLVCKDQWFCPTASLKTALHEHIVSWSRLKRDQIRRVSIASVVKEATEDAESALRSLPGVTPHRVHIHAQLPVQFTYDNQERLGADRIADCLYAAAALNGKSAIIIDAGTAITIDLLCGNQFRGGCILPGPTLQFASLHAATDSLPLVDQGDATVFMPGTSTSSCIRAGVAYGIAGGVERAVEELRKASERSCVILATGGAWPSLAPLARFEYQFVPDLTLIGTALFVPPSS